MDEEKGESIVPRMLVMCPHQFGDTDFNKTITNLFKNWNKESLAQFYINEGTPSYSICANFFRITDLEVLNANLKFKVAEGTVFTTNTVEEAKDGHNNDVSINEVAGLKSYVFQLLRKLITVSSSAVFMVEIAWRKRKWLSQNLVNWLDEYRPQAVFCYNYSMSFFLKIAHWVCRRYEIPLFLYATDDYTYCTHVYSPVAWLHHFYYMKWFRKCLRMARRFYASNPGMRDEYSRKFGISNSGLIFNCVPMREDVSIEDFAQNPLRLVYAGNLYFSRWKVLVFLADCLLVLHNQGFRVKLDIYCERTPHNKILVENLNKHPVSAFKGSLNQEDLFDEIEKSNILVHVESWDCIWRVRLSISTKISDYLANNRMILAIGPKEVESMRYLKGSGAALCINTMDKDEVVAMLKNSLFDADYRRQLAKKGRMVASENHDMLKIQSMLYKDLRESVEKSWNI